MRIITEPPAIAYPQSGVIAHKSLCNTRHFVFAHRCGIYTHAFNQHSEKLRRSGYATYWTWRIFTCHSL